MLSCPFLAVTSETLHEPWYNHDNTAKSFKLSVTFNSLLSVALKWQLPDTMVKYAALLLPAQKSWAQIAVWRQVMLNENLCGLRQPPTLPGQMLESPHIGSSSHHATVMLSLTLYRICY
jgi:hypothetical protein